MAKEPGKHHHKGDHKGAKGDHKKSKKDKDGKDGKKHSHANSEHKKKHSKAKTPPTSYAEETKTPPTSSGEEPFSTDVPTMGDETSGSEPESPSDVEAGRGKKGSKKSDKSLVSMPPTEVKDKSDNGRDMHPAGRFCLLLGSFVLMAGMIYLVMQVYQWVGRSERIFGDSSPLPDPAKNPAASSMAKAYKL